MASGKQTPRQKMINLMYLIFIAMLALNMSKEVLSAFGLMNEKLEASNAKTTDNNNAFLASLEVKASENTEKFGPLYEKASQIQKLSSEYYNYLGDLKNRMTEKLEDDQDYEVMDKSDFLDQEFFQGDNYTKEGKDFVGRIDGYRIEVSRILGEDFKEVASTLDSRFSTGENGKATNRDGKKIDWLDYHIKGFPLVASLPPWWIKWSAISKTFAQRHSLCRPIRRHSLHVARLGGNRGIQS